MKFSRYLFTSILILTFEASHAHEDFATVRYYGNIKVRVITGGYYEEINKALIIGQLAQKLSKELKYSNPIFLDFIHYYVDDYSPDYFLSFDKGAITYPIEHMDGKEKDNIKIPGIVVRQVSRFFDVATTLKLLEYSIKNTGVIKVLQKSINYKRLYSDYKINSIDSNLIKSLVAKPNSVLVDSILNQKVFRPQKKPLDYGVSYYWQSNKYFIFLRGLGIFDSVVKRNGSEAKLFTYPVDSVMKVIDNVYIIDEPYGNPMAIFDSDSSFYYLKQLYNEIDGATTHISKRNVLQNIKVNWELNLFSFLGDNKLSLTLPVYNLNAPPKYRTLIYLVDEDELIQDLDKLIEKR